MSRRSIPNGSCQDRVVTLQELKHKIAKFVKDRDWEQFHSPKNLSMSIAIEAAELMEHFQWLTTEESKKLKTQNKKMREIEDEIADIGAFLLNLCNVMDIDFSFALTKKLGKNAKKYPINKSKGSAKKYTDF